MKEQIVSFETAVLAKEKGFEESTEYFYSVSGVRNSNYGRNSSSNDWSYAPTQSLLQKWLREVHKIHVEVTHFTEQPIDDEVWADCYQVFVKGGGLHPYHKTYEESLEFGLLTALKLMKNGKNIEKNSQENG